MVSNFPSAVSKTICVDLLNLSFEELQNLSIINPIVDTFSLYLFSKHKELHNDLLDKDIPHLFYMEEDFIIGSRRHGEKYNNLSLGGFEILPEPNSSITDSNLYNEIESTLINNNSLYLTPFLVDCFKSAFRNPVEKEYHSTSFVNAHIEVSDKLRLTPEQIKRRFRISTIFLSDDIKSINLLLKKIYYKDQLPLLFIFIDENNNEYVSWNKDYLVALNEISPINFNSLDNETTLNTILDKINEDSLNNIKSEELNFLVYYSNL